MTTYNNPNYFNDDYFGRKFDPQNNISDMNTNYIDHKGQYHRGRNRKNLSKKDGTIAKIILDNKDTIWAAQSVPGIVLILAKLFNEQHLDTEASRRLLDNVSNSASLTAAQATVAYSYVAGCGDATIR